MQMPRCDHVDYMSFADLDLSHDSQLPSIHRSLLAYTCTNNLSCRSVVPVVQLDGREMFVREDREPPGERKEQKESPAGPAAASGANMKRGRRERGGQGEGASPVDAIPVGRRLYVNNLSYDTTWTSLKDHFRSAGNVLYADILMVRSRLKDTGSGDHSAGNVLYAQHCSLHCSAGHRAGNELHVLLLQTCPTCASTCTFRNVGFLHGCMCCCDVTAGACKQQVTRLSCSCVHADCERAQDGERSKGCGIVEFEQPEEALRAISLLSNSVSLHAQQMCSLGHTADLALQAAHDQRPSDSMLPAQKQQARCVEGGCTLWLALP